MLTDLSTGNRGRAAAWALTVAACIAASGVAHADSTAHMYGDPNAAAPYWRYQHQQDCGLMAVADVVGQITGREPPQAGIQLRGVLTKSASHTGTIYHFDGTSPEDLVVLLHQFGIDSQLSTGNTLTTLEQDLASGHKVIATVNAETIWNTGTGNRSGADHAVVVTGLDTGTDLVHLNDSGIPTGRDEQVPLTTFSQAWATGNNELIVTQ